MPANNFWPASYLVWQRQDNETSGDISITRNVLTLKFQKGHGMLSPSECLKVRTQKNENEKCMTPNMSAGSRSMV